LPVRERLVALVKRDERKHEGLSMAA
jgi:hypothetical protein